VVANGLRFVRQIVRVYPNAMPAHQARFERHKVPLGAGGGQHQVGV